MVTIKAVDTIVSANGVVTGFILEEVETGKRMQVPSNSILSAIKANKISISNIEVTSDDRLVIKDIENKEIDCVITKDLSRLGRNYIQVGYYLHYFHHHLKV